jgi:deazaflavin-dependent oxidoreductase (nitroreductase family)
MLLLDHVGAKSGKKRTSPLLYVEDGENVFVIASKGGFPKHPAWYHNLVANPDTMIQIRSERRAVHARVATPQERERLWPIAVRAYSGYEDYAARSKGREIPIVVLEPR